MSKRQLNRREFMAAAGLLLGSAGVSALVKNDLISKITKEIFPKANAASAATQVDFMIELCGRAGSPVIFLGTGAEFTQAGGNNYPNVPMQQTSNLQQRGGANGARPVYMNSVAGGANSVAALLGPHADNIAISQGLSSQGLGHTELFGQREGVQGMGLTTPIIEFADRAKRTPAYGALVVHGVNWNRRGVINKTNGLQDLVDVNGSTQFTNLFKEPVLRLSRNEVALVAEAAKKLTLEQGKNLRRRIQNMEAVADSQAKGAELLSRDFTQLLSVNGMNSNFMAGQPFNNMGTNWGDIGGALAYTCKAFENGLIAAATISYNSNDWHEFQDLSNTSYQANAGVYMARVLSATIQFLKTTPHPFRAGETLWDRTLIQMSSEFTRGISRMNQDNNDGGTAGFLLAGGKIKGGYYGSFDLSGTGGGRAYGFNIQTGVATNGMRNSTGALYNTVSDLLGNTSKVSSEGVMTCLVRG